MSYQKTILDNGITILSEKIDYVRSIAVGVWVNAGSRDENSNNRGIAHFLEHMLFKGTKKRGKYEIAHFLESLGGAVNAFTSHEFTCFYARALSEHLKQSMDILSDIVQNSIFPDEEIEKEKNVVIDEINEIKDDPGEFIFERFYENLFPEHPLGYPILGYKKDVERFNKSDCYSFIYDHYIPKKIIITASGLLKHEELVQYVKQYFHSERLDSKLNTKREFSTIPKIKREMNIYNDAANNQTHICTGIRTFPYNDNRRLPLLVLNAILSAGMSSRLFQNIREKYGIAYDIYSFTDFFHDTGVFAVYSATTPENSEKCLELIQSEISSLAERPVTKTELATTKAQLKSSLVMGLESTTARMNRLAKQYIYTKKIESIDKVIEAIDCIKQEDIQSLAQELFQQGKFVTTILRTKRVKTL